MTVEARPKEGSVESAAQRIAASLNAGQTFEGTLKRDQLPQESDTQEAQGEEPDGLLEDAPEGEEPQGEEDGQEAPAAEEGEEQPEGDSDPEADDAQAQNDDDDEGTPEEPLETLADLARAMDREVDDLLDNLKHTITVNGEEIEVNLRELAQGHMRQQDYTRKSQAVKKEREELKVREAKHRDDAQAALRINQTMVDHVTRAVQAELDTPQMRQLAQKDPSRYVVERDNIQRRLSHLQQIRQAAAVELQREIQANEQQITEDLKAYRDEQLELLENLVPGLPSDKERKARLASYLQDEIGFEDDDLKGLMDARTLALAHRAMKAEAELKALRAGTKPRPEKQQPQRGLRPGKGGRPGAASQTAAARAAKAQRDKLKSTGKVEDAAAIIAGRMTQPNRRRRA